MLPILQIELQTVIDRAQLDPGPSFGSAYKRCNTTRLCTAFRQQKTPGGFFEPRVRFFQYTAKRPDRCRSGRWYVKPGESLARERSGCSGSDRWAAPATRLTGPHTVKRPDHCWTGRLKLKPGDDLLSHGETPHYHRRCIVSLLSSGRDQVVPMLYGRQANWLEPTLRLRAVALACRVQIGW
jgi:hypothetical protein